MKTTQGAGNFYEASPEAIAKLKAAMANAPRRLRPLLSDEKMTVVGNGRKKQAWQRKERDAHSNQPFSRQP